MCCALSCKNDKVYFFISNSSKIDTTLQLELILNSQKVLSEEIKYTTVTPSYQEYEFSDIKVYDSIDLNIKTSTGIVKNIKIPKNKKYIFITYSYDVINDTAGAYKAHTDTKHISGTDSIIRVPRDILVQGYAKKPLID